MKKRLFFIMLALIMLSMNACQKTFLQKPNTTGVVNLDVVYSSSLNATSALMTCYRNTLQALWAGGYTMGLNNSLACISGERCMGYNFQQPYVNAQIGLLATGGGAGPAVSYGNVYNVIRQCALVNENIDKVPDMTDSLKKIVHAEAQGLIAYNYLIMFKDYGGVPLVSHSFAPTDNLAAPRGTLQQTLDFATGLCDAAIAGLPNSWPSTLAGRLTKGAVMCMKAQMLLFAARPLFNTATPYESLGANNNLICFGNTDPTRWNAVISATNTALTWALNNGYTLINTGGAGVGAPNPNALNDYGTATSTPSNPEMILADKYDGATSPAIIYYNQSPYQTTSHYDSQLENVEGNFLPNWMKADGTEQSWPKVGDLAPRPATDYATRYTQMEPRFLADVLGPGGTVAANNPTDAKWTVANWGYGLANYGTAPAFAFPQVTGYGYGIGATTKFFYHAGSRLWFEYPIFRVAELYLNLAEAYNETGQTTLALQNLNMVHNRAGLPSITITDQATLRTAIQREWAVEFFGESKRYFDVKHWRLPNIGNGILGGQVWEFEFSTTSASNKNILSSLINYWAGNTYTFYWDNRMFLEPFPQSEVNKLAVIQNPGY